MNYASEGFVVPVSEVKPKKYGTTNLDSCTEIRYTETQEKENEK